MIGILKIIIYGCLILGFFTQCIGQKEKGVIYPKEKIMTTDIFDIEKYNQVIEEKKIKGLPRSNIRTEILEDGTIIESSQSQKKYVTVRIIPKTPKIFETYKKYYPNGFLEMKMQRFMGLAMGANIIKTGISEYYNEKGELIKKVDEEVKYADIVIKPMDLFEILKKTPLFIEVNKEEASRFKEIFDIDKKVAEITSEDIHIALKKYVILDVTDQEQVRNVFINLSKDEKTWRVTRDIYPLGRVKLEVDTNTGKVLSQTYQQETRS
ncbi:hypothetical protein GCM10022393_19370 [Aquimarina addita]|uniref:PepSY domain-containing protein n=1 Tax=Aquimarina addita TaxID=870485 RepID=A0ABP6UK20_9FLAO